MALKNLVFIVMDSCRFDSYQAAKTPNMDALGEGSRRYSFASWTSPSHYTYLMGMIPHESPQGVFASEVYKKDFSKWVDRLGIDGLSFKSFIPELSLPKVLQSHGYRTEARVSLPVLNPFSHLNRHFDEYKLMPNHNDFVGIVDQIEFDQDEPSFHFLNLGETHYPYMLDPKTMPHISGVHGVFKRMDDHLGTETEDKFFDADQMRMLHLQQTKTVEYVDEVLAALIDKAPKDTHFIVTADHGECFGESGYFGHGPIVHEKVLEVPFLEGCKR
ncbi:MAG: sulfatase-like hydrolase/transferase [Gammaproteobacteria bacterium]|nr:sulfatase-like hydrolase/transferase [Gammaproteobacteria bacterium]